MATTYITDEMSNAVGRELARMTSYPITDSDIRRWAVAVYYPDEPPRLFWDAEYAAGTPYGSVVAPEEFNPFAWLSEGGNAPVQGPRRRRRIAREAPGHHRAWPDARRERRHRGGVRRADAGR